jgi:hypothetical protein
MWRGTDRIGRRVSLTRAALRHARGEDETKRERRIYISKRIVKVAVERGRRYADMTDGRERLIANDVGPSAYLVVVIEVRAKAGTVVTAYAMRRIPNAWRPL